MTAATEEETILVPLTAADRARRRMLVAVCFVLFATMLDTTIVSVALGDLEKTTTLSLGDLQWILNGYLVMFTAFMLAGGTLADAFGRRTFLMIGLAVFAFGSLLCVAGGAHYLVIGRLVQGVGAAMSEPATLAVIRHEYEDSAERTRALGIWAATGGIALAVGPVLGGILVAAGGWKAVFLFNIPLALVCIAVGFFLVPNSSDPDPEALDLLGVALSAIAIVSVSYLFIHSQSYGFAAVGSILSLLLTVLAGGGFLFWQKRSPAPLLPRGLFASGIVRGGAIGTLVSGFALYAVFFFGTLDLSVIGNRTAAVTAAAFVPMMIAMISCAIFGGNWAAARGPGEPLAVGLLTAAIATGLAVPTLGVDPQAPVVAVVFMVAGIGLGLCLAPGASAIMGGLSADRSGLAAALVNEARMLGGLLAVAVLGNITVGRLQSGIDARICHPSTILCSFEPQILHAITHGQDDPATKQVSSLKSVPTIGKIIDQALNAAYSAFASGMRLALVVTVVLLVLATIYVFVFRNSSAPAVGVAAAAPVAATVAAELPVGPPVQLPEAPVVVTPPPAAPPPLPPPVAPPPQAAPPPPQAAPPPPPAVAPPPPAAAPPAAEPVPAEPAPADPGWAPPIEPSWPEPAPTDESWSEAERWWQEGQGG